MTNKNGKTFILSGCLSKLEIHPLLTLSSSWSRRVGMGSRGPEPEQSCKVFCQSQNMKALFQNDE